MTTSLNRFDDAVHPLIGRAANGASIFRDNLKRNALCVAVVIFMMVSPATLIASAQDILPASARNPIRAASEKSITAAGSLIHDGDKIKLSFYEIFDSEEAKWRGPNGRSALSSREFHERTELNGEYVVQMDGTISIPMLGSFKVEGRDRQTLIDNVAGAFEQLIGRKGSVSILALERRPIFVVGPVKNPGSFKYDQGLTALHAVALAGGMLRSEAEPWQNIESRREMIALAKSLERAKRLIARTVVLQADHNDQSLDPTQNANSAIRDLVSLIGQQDSKLLLAQETSRNRLGQIDRAVRGSALATSITNYRAELKARLDRVTPFDDNIKLRSERVKALEELVGKNLATRASLVQAQSELTDVQDRRQQAMIEVDATRQKLIETQRQLATYNLETRSEIEQAVASAERDGADAIANSEGSLNVLRTFGAVTSGSDDGSVAFEIIRSGPDGARVIKATETTLLEPGDLLRVQSRSQGATTETDSDGAMAAR